MTTVSDVEHLERLMAQTFELEDRVRHLESVIARLRDEFDRVVLGESPADRAADRHL